MAPDGSLYIPERIPPLPESFVQHLENESLHTIGAQVASQFIDEVPEASLLAIVQEAWNFPIPLVKLEEGLYLLELFHGPTLAFKDVGARFMAHALSHFLEKEKKGITVVVATSGDTGGAVARGFFNVPHISVFVLYPSGKISKLQEQQMTTLGGNIHALEVEGTFDDCQRLVKQALADPEIIQARSLTTANSINIGRLIPQIIYYFWGVAQLRRQGKPSPLISGGPAQPIVVVPSGNFGNLTAAVYSKWMGNPIVRFIAATNANHVVPDYFSSGTYTPRPSVQTYSNAMDVGNPSNFARLQALYECRLEQMRRDISAVSVSDEETLAEIRRTYDRTGYVLDPHTAVGVAATRQVHSSTVDSSPVVVVATAHPGKFPDVVEKALGRHVSLPPALLEAMKQRKTSTRIPPEYSSWKGILLQSAC
jgi:threonine synthase